MEAGAGVQDHHDPHGVRPPPPTTLQLEVTASCNLRCPMCLVAYRPRQRRHGASVRVDELERLLDEVPSVRDLTLQGLGEPLLAPDIVELVRTAARRDVRVGFNTNATLLTGPVARSLIEAGLDWLAISLDGATAATYEATRVGARFDRVVANIEGFVAARRELTGGRRPSARLVLVAMRRNLHELAAVVRLAGRLGIGEVSVQNLAHDFTDVADQPGYVEIRRFTDGQRVSGGADRAVAGTAARAFAAARAEAARTGVELHLPPLEPPPPAPRRPGERGCDWPWRAAYVTRGGDLQPCCMVMGTDRSSFGNAFTDGFAAAWHGDRAASFRAALLTDEPPAVCRGCSYYRGVF